ncbi:MAG: malto-oligosyltrehalose trehalohydrolase, partial [Chloroflexota bacterium]
MSTTWQLDLGANVTADGVQFRIWAPNANAVEVVLSRPGEEERHPLTPAADGYHAGAVAGAKAGDRYRYSLDGGPPFPDPCSR